jgi:acetyl esterase/lipase
MFSCLFLFFVVVPTFFFLTSWLVLWLWLKGPDLREFDQPEIRRVTERTEASPETLQVHELLAKMRDNTGPMGAKGRLARMREAFDNGFGERPRDGASLGVEIIESDAAGVPAEWVLAPGSDPRKRLLYVHGGAFYVGSPKSHRALTAALAKRTGLTVFSIDYRLMPENSRKDGIADCQSAYRFLIDNGPDGPTSLDRMFVAGDSAGGNLTLMLIAWARDQGLRPVDAAVALSPATDSTMSSPTVRENAKSDVMLGPLFRPLLRFPLTAIRFWGMVGVKMHPRNPLISPLLGDLSGLPPVLIQASESEILLGDARRYVNKARAAGSEAELQTWPGQVHVFQAFEGVVPEADEALDRIAEFLGSHS